VCVCEGGREEEGVCSPGVVHSAQTQSRLFSKDVYIQRWRTGVCVGVCVRGGGPL